MKSVYYFELHAQLKFKAEVMCFPSKKRYSLETLLRLQGNPQKYGHGEIDIRLQNQWVHRSKSRVPQEKVKWEIIHHKNFKNSRLWLTLQVSDVFSQYIMRQLPYRTCYKRLYRCKHTQTKPLLYDRNASDGRSHQHVSFAILVSRLFWGFFGFFVFVCLFCWLFF